MSCPQYVTIYSSRLARRLGEISVLTNGPQLSSLPNRKATSQPEKARFMVAADRPFQRKSDNLHLSGRLRRSLCHYNVESKHAKVAELADAPDLGSGGETRGGSSPPFRTNNLRGIVGFAILGFTPLDCA